jgi:hypothetical protein
MPPGFPAKPPGAVPLYRIPKTTGKGKTNPAAGQAVFKHKQFCAAAAKGPSPAKNRPNIAPSL